MTRAIRPGPGFVKSHLSLAFALIYVLGCAEPGSESASDPGGVRDSSGITIVEIPPSQLEDAPEWTVRAEPAEEIGGVDGPSARQLYEVRGVLRLPDGRIAVANGSPPEIRVFGDDDRQEETLGREGDGPGEFRSLDGFAHVGGDTLAVLDLRLGRITRFSTAAYLDHRSVPPVASTEGAMRTADGSWIVRTWPRPPGGRPRSTGPQWFRSALVRIEPDGTSVDTLRIVDGPWMIVTEVGPRWKAERRWLTHDSDFAVTGSTVWVGDSRRFQLRELNLEGRETRILRVLRKPRDATSDAVDSLVERRAAGVAEPAARERLVRRLREDPVPDVLPVFHRIRAAAGRLWVEVSRSVPGRGSRWIVLDPVGRVEARLHLPPRFDPHRFAANWVLGVREDDVGIERVRLYTVVRGR
jgi:hypothetical protein